MNDNDTKHYTDYKMKSIAAIANSTRHLACAGIRPEVCSGFVAVSNVNLEEKGSYLAGIQSAGKHLNINVQHVSFEQTDNPMDGEFCSGALVLGMHYSPMISLAQIYSYPCWGAIGENWEEPVFIPHQTRKYRYSTGG